MASVLIVDAANVVGSVPDGWWKDRAGAARRLHERLLVADLSADRVVLVLEGQAKGGVKSGRDGHVVVVHAPKDGDSQIVREVDTACQRGERVTLVSADQMLRARVQGLGALAMSPSWLLDQI